MTPQEESLLARLTKAEATVERQDDEIKSLMLIINSFQKALTDARIEIIALEGVRRTNKI